MFCILACSVHGAVITEWNDKSSVSLGMFVFVTKEPYFYNKLKDGYTKDELSKIGRAHV